MANFAQFDLGAKGQQARIRALLEDLTDAYVGIRPESRLALAVWFAKSSSTVQLRLLLVFNGPPVNGIVHADQPQPLLWKTGATGPPFVYIEWTDVAWFSSLFNIDPVRIADYQRDYEILHFDKNLLTPQILDKFRLVTEPQGFMKGWYITQDEYARSQSVQDLLSTRGLARPHFGIVKTEEKDFEQCRGILHIEVSQKWLPLSPEGIQPYAFFNDLQKGCPVYFLFEGGALYEVLRFEVKTAPDYASRFGLLGRPLDDRYPEVYLRAVRPSAQPAA
jgi:hypothetical protein